MALVITRNPEECGQPAWEFLQAGVERNILATVFRGAGESPAPGSQAPLFAFHAAPDGQLTGLALRTPPWPLLATGFTDPDLAGDLVRRWVAHDPAVPGVGAEPDTARAISAAWVGQTGGSARCEFEEAMHVLTQVVSPKRPAPGHLRPPESGEHELLIGWERDFFIETGLGTGEHAEQTAQRRLAARRQVVWEDAGNPVSTAGFTLQVAGTVRIGPVYTPPQLRGRGYATSAVAATSQLLLDRGARQCMLLTDLANPTSNRIYASIGYVRCGAWEQHGFLAA